VELDGEAYLTRTELVGQAFEAFKAVGLRPPARVQPMPRPETTPPVSVVVRSPRVPKKALCFKGSQGSRCQSRVCNAGIYISFVFPPFA